MDPLELAIIDLEVAEDAFHAAAFTIDSKRRGYGYGPGSSTRREDARYLDDLKRTVDLAGFRVGLEADAAWTVTAADDATWHAFGRWLAVR